MEIAIAATLGTFIGGFAVYFYYHKQNFSYVLSTLKEDLVNIQVKLEQIISVKDK